MAGILFIVNVPKKEYENNLKEINVPNLKFDKEKIEKASKLIDELKEIHLTEKTVDDKVIKCKSTDSYHSNGEDDRGSYTKGSWGEIKQVFKAKNKLKINGSVRSVDILGAFRCDTPLETILSEVVSRLDIKNAAWNSTRGDKFWQVIFSLESGCLSEELLQVLRTFGIGSRYQSSVSLLPCALYYKSNDRVPSTSEVYDADSETNSAWSRFSSSVRARTNLAQVLNDVKANGTLTFDWVFMLLVAAFVAAIGLVENSTVVLVASMLISPLMGPITAGTLGTAVRDRSLQLMGVKNEFLGLFLCLVVGFVVGLTICALDERYGVIEDWPTEEMLFRCAARSLWLGVLVALPSGAGCALAVLGDYTASLVGVAISASLLPPAVNAGLLWAMALTRLVMKSTPRWRVVLPAELALLGTASLCLTLVNIICVFLAGVTVYKVKEVSPLDRRDISWWRANRDRFNATRQQNKKDSLEWNAYTTWCTNSLEKKTKEKAEDNEKTYDEPSSLDSSACDRVLHRRRPSVIRRWRAQHVSGLTQSIQLEDNYIALNPAINVDLEKQFQMMMKSHEVQDLNEETEKKTSTTAIDEDSLTHRINLGYENDEFTTKPHLPTIVPSLSLTVDNKKTGVSYENVTYNI